MPEDLVTRAKNTPITLFEVKNHLVSYLFHTRDLLEKTVLHKNFTTEDYKAFARRIRDESGTEILPSEVQEALQSHTTEDFETEDFEVMEMLINLRKRYGRSVQINQINTEELAGNAKQQPVRVITGMLVNVAIWKVLNEYGIRRPTTEEESHQRQTELVEINMACAELAEAFREHK